MVLPDLGINTEARVCEGCYARRVAGDKTIPVVVQSQAKAYPTTTANPYPAVVDTDADLARAIQLSLDEAQKSSSSAPAARKQTRPGEVFYLN